MCLGLGIRVRGVETGLAYVFLIYVRAELSKDVGIYKY